MRAYKFSDMFVPFNSDQMTAMRNFGTPGIRLLGFKDATAAGWEYSLEKAYFLYPSETHYVGSSRTFAALHRSLTEKKKVALVWAVLRVNAPPRIAAIVPHGPVITKESEESVKETAQHPTFPTGLYLVPLAYADDLRHLPPAATNKTARTTLPSTELVASAKTLVQALRMSIGYSPRRYPNPHLSHFYQTLQRAVFEEEEDDEDKEKAKMDGTRPKYNSIYKRAREATLTWTKELRRLEYQPAQMSNYAASVTGKRARDNDSASIPASKRSALNGDYVATDDTSAEARGTRRPRNAGATTETASLERAIEHPLFERLLRDKIMLPLNTRFDDLSVTELREFADVAGIATRASTKAGLRSAVSRYFEEHFEK